MALTVKQQRFVDAYDGDIKRAAKKAKLSYSYARKLLMRADVKDQIRNREGTKRNKNIATRLERQEFWTKIMNSRCSKTVGMSDKLRASELLGKSEMDFAEKHVHEFGKGWKEYQEWLDSE